MNTLISWVLNSTLTVAVVYLISFYFGIGDQGSFINAMLALMLLVAYVVLRSSLFWHEWIMIGLATIFIVITVGAGLALTTIYQYPMMGPASPEWQFVRGTIAGVAVFVSAIFSVAFSQNAAVESGLKRSRVFLVFLTQALILNTVFRYGPVLVPKIFGQ